MALQDDKPEGSYNNAPPHIYPSPLQDKHNFHLTADHTTPLYLSSPRDKRDFHLIDDTPLYPSSLKKNDKHDSQLIGFSNLKERDFFDRRDFEIFENSANKRTLLEIAKKQLREGKGTHLLERVQPLPRVPLSGRNLPTTGGTSDLALHRVLDPQDATSTSSSLRDPRSFLHGEGGAPRMLFRSSEVVPSRREKRRRRRGGVLLLERGREDPLLGGKEGSTGQTNVFFSLKNRRKNLKQEARGVVVGVEGQPGGDPLFHEDDGVFEDRKLQFQNGKVTEGRYKSKHISSMHPTINTALNDVRDEYILSERDTVEKPESPHLQEMRIAVSEAASDVATRGSYEMLEASFGAPIPSRRCVEGGVSVSPNDGGVGMSSTRIDISHYEKDASQRLVSSLSRNDEDFDQSSCNIPFSKKDAKEGGKGTGGSPNLKGFCPMIKAGRVTQSDVSEGDMQKNIFGGKVDVLSLEFAQKRNAGENALLSSNLMQKREEYGTNEVGSVCATSRGGLEGDNDDFGFEKGEKYLGLMGGMKGVGSGATTQEIHLTITEHTPSNDLSVDSTLKNTRARKRIIIPDCAYQEADANDSSAARAASKNASEGERVKDKIPRKIIKMIAKQPIIYTGNLESFCERLEAEIEHFLKICTLHGSVIIGPEDIYSYLLGFKPINMHLMDYLIWCRKPLGMDIDEYLEVLKNDDKEKQEELLRNFMQKQIDNAGAHTLIEMNYFQEMKILQKKSKRLKEDMELWKTVYDKMYSNFQKMLERFAETSKNGYRLTAGYSSLRWGRIYNMLTWKRGDPIVRESGFSEDMLQSRLAALKQQIADTFQDEHDGKSSARIKPGQDIYYSKLLKDLKKEQKLEELGRKEHDRLQAMAEFSMKRPVSSNLPEGWFIWKCMGLSFHSQLWKVLSLNHHPAYVCKFQSLAGLTEEELSLLKISFASAEAKMNQRYMPKVAAKSLKFSTGGGVKIEKGQLIEICQFIPHLSLCEYVEKFGNFNKSVKGYRKAKEIIRFLVRLINSLSNLDFILPLKTSKIYLEQKNIIFCAGFPRSLLSEECLEILKMKTEPTIASVLWAEDMQKYLPPECEGKISSLTGNAESVSKAHTWIIGCVLYKLMFGNLNRPFSFKDLNEDVMFCELNSRSSELQDFLRFCLVEDQAKRPLLSSLLSHKYTTSEEVYADDVELINALEAPSSIIQSAMEAFPDMQAIVSTTLKGGDKGVAVYQKTSLTSGLSASWMKSEEMEGGSEGGSSDETSASEDSDEATDTESQADRTFSTDDD